VSFDHTRKALTVYDQAAPERSAAWSAALTNQEDFAEAVARDKRDGDVVREAFYQDTQHTNSRDRAFLVHPDDPWFRRLVANHP